MPRQVGSPTPIGYSADIEIELRYSIQLLLANKFEALNSAPSDDIDTYCDSITSSITEAALKTAGKDKAQRHDKLSLSQNSCGRSDGK